MAEDASGRTGNNNTSNSANNGAVQSGGDRNANSQSRRRDDGRMGQSRVNPRERGEVNQPWQQRIERVGRFDQDNRTGQANDRNQSNSSLYSSKDGSIPSLTPKSYPSSSSPSGVSVPVQPLIPATSFPEPTNDPQYSLSNIPVHPLQNRWILWFDHKIQKKGGGPLEADDYESNLNEVGSFASVEGFWQVFHHVLLPSQLEMGANYHLFKSGIKPTWEDSSNAEGGKWAVRFTNREKGHVDYYWLNIAMAVIGETIDEGDEICGAVFSKRKGGDRIAIWIRSKDKEAELMRIGQRIKTALMDGIPGISLSLAFDAHETALTTGHSYHAAVHKFEIK
jgi:translation initiation factor 4E